MKKRIQLIGGLALITALFAATPYAHGDFVEEFDGAIISYTPDGLAAPGGTWVDFQNRINNGTDALGTASTGESVLAGTPPVATAQIRSDFIVGLTDMTNVQIRIRIDLNKNDTFDDVLTVNSLKLFHGPIAYSIPGAGNVAGTPLITWASATADGGNGWYILDSGPISVAEVNCIRIDVLNTDAKFELDYLKIGAAPTPFEEFDDTIPYVAVYSNATTGTWVDFQDRIDSDGYARADTGESVLAGTANVANPQVRPDFPLGYTDVTNIQLRIRIDKNLNSTFDDTLGINDMRIYTNSVPFASPGAGNVGGLALLTWNSATSDGGNGWYILDSGLIDIPDLDGIRLDVTFVAGAKFEIDYLKIETGVSVDPFALIPDPNYIHNGDLDEATTAPNQVTGQGYNITNSFGDFAPFYGNTAVVPGWDFYYNDPNGLTGMVGVPGVDNSGDVPVPDLEGTFYLDTHWQLDNTDDTDGLITLNSSSGYLNGLMQTNFLDGVTINPALTYVFSFQARQNPGTVNSSSTMTVALTTGADATNTANALSGTLFQMTATDLPTTLGAVTYSTNIAGADLLAAQSNGAVNAIFNQVNATMITSFPPGINVGLVAQVQFNNLSLTPVLPANDLNKDGSFDSNDVDLSILYLNGDGGDPAPVRQDILISQGSTGAEALAELNLTDFDINGDDYFDAADILILQDLLGISAIIIDSIAVNGSGDVTVTVSEGLYGKQYYLQRASDLPSGFTDTIDSAEPDASFAVVLTDTNAPANQAFYQVTD